MSTYRRPPSADIDLFDDQVLLDPYPVYATLRETAGVVYLPQNEAYALTRYDIVRDALADWETFSSVGLGFNDMVNGALQGTSLASDPPAHTELRAALSENLTPRALRNLKELIDAKADALVADLVEQGSFEAIDALARAFPLEVVADLIGFTGDVRNNMIRWGAAAMEVVGPLNQRTGRELPDRRRAVRLVRPGHRGGPRARVRGLRRVRGRGPGHHPGGFGRPHHPPVPRCRPRQHDRGDRQHGGPVRGASGPARTRAPGSVAGARGLQRGAALLGAAERVGSHRDQGRRDRRHRHPRRVEGGAS